MTVFQAPTAPHRLRRTRRRSHRRGASHDGRPALRPATLDAVIVGGGSVANAIGSGSRVAYAVALDLVPEMAPVAA